MGDDRQAQNEADTRSGSGRVGLRGPLALWAILLASFLAVVALYAAFAEPFILNVYEMEQIDRSTSRSLSKSIIDYEDYLRADPTSIRIRGRVVSALIVERRYAKAIEHAEHAIEYADESQRSVAELIAARAHLAAGDIEAASDSVRRAVDASPESGEAHFTLARIAAARGKFSEMEEAYARMYTLGALDSSREYSEEWEARTGGMGERAAAMEENNDSARLVYEYANALERLGRIDEAMALFAKAAALRNAPAEAFYWSGVQAERAGDRTEALKRYRRAAESTRSHPNAPHAVARLQPSS